jgi:hypothetical protein
MGTTKSSNPPPKEKKKPWPLECMLPHPIGYKNSCYLRVLFVIFGPMLMTKGMNHGVSVVYWSRG